MVRGVGEHLLLNCAASFFGTGLISCLQPFNALGLLDGLLPTESLRAVFCCCLAAAPAVEVRCVGEGDFLEGICLTPVPPDTVLDLGIGRGEVDG